MLLWTTIALTVIFISLATFEIGKDKGYRAGYYDGFDQGLFYEDKHDD